VIHWLAPICGGAHVDPREPRSLRSPRFALPERPDGCRMGPGATVSAPSHEVRASPGALARDLNAVLYVLSTGCQWRALPRDLPPRSTVHGWFVRWHCDGVLDRLHFALYQQVRELEGRHASPTAAIVDSQSVKSAEKGGGLSIRSAMTRPRKSRARSVTSSSTRWA
jgi:transposase